MGRIGWGDFTLAEKEKQEKHMGLMKWLWFQAK